MMKMRHLLEFFVCFGFLVSSAYAQTFPSYPVFEGGDKPSITILKSRNPVISLDSSKNNVANLKVFKPGDHVQGFSILDKSSKTITLLSPVESYQFGKDGVMKNFQVRKNTAKALTTRDIDPNTFHNEIDIEKESRRYNHPLNR